jgi:RNA polymerase sigma-70 factor (ECF subfamily)
MSTTQPPRSPASESPARRLHLVASESDQDLRLVERIRERDQAALGALYDRWSERVYAVAFHLVGNRDDAEEVVEKSFSQVWAEADRYHVGRGSVEAWIILIARSRALDRLRLIKSRMRREERLDEKAAGQLADDGESPLQGAAAGERRDIVDRAVSRLPGDQQRVVRMTFFEGLTQREIAHELGVPLGTVKTRTRLAFPKLRALLSGLREPG